MSSAPGPARDSPADAIAPSALQPSQPCTLATGADAKRAAAGQPLTAQSPPPPPPPSLPPAKLGGAQEHSDGEGAEWDAFDLVDEPNVDLSFPPPGTDTRSNAAPFEFTVGQHVFWPTRDGELHGVVESVAVTDTVLSSPARAFVGPMPRAGKGMGGGGGFIESDPLPCRVRGRLSDPLYIVRDDDGRQHAMKVRDGGCLTA
jgi:hypothetical protein